MSSLTKTQHRLG